ncbi:MAG: RidA family protein [Candidatus Dormibacteraeota bacterium]|nr:RidA family protein [Candidatus Dormibacteraeota bacterium]
MERIGTGRPLERQIGFSRVVVIGNLAAVSGCAPTNPDGSSAGGDDPYLQAKACLEVIKAALDGAGFKLEDVYRTRMYITDPAEWEAVGRAHGEYFADTPPASTMVVVKGLLRPEWRVEIEADALRLRAGWTGHPSSGEMADQR